MKTLIARVFFGFALTSTLPAWSAEIAWLQLYTQTNYTDSSLVCQSGRPGGSFVFAAELEGDRALRVVLSNYPYEWPFQYIYRSIELTEPERSLLKIYRDSKGKPWLKRLELSERTLQWIHFQPAASSRECGPPRPVLEVTPAHAAFEFETDDINVGLLLSYSQRTTFTGTRTDGVRFESKLRLVQKPYSRFGGFQ